jgi:hypothetical protein
VPHANATDGISNSSPIFFFEILWFQSFGCCPEGPVGKIQRESHILLAAKCKSPRVSIMPISEYSLRTAGKRAARRKT